MGDPFEDLNAAIERQVAHLPPNSPEREAALNRLGEKALAIAKTPKEKLFWEAFLGKK